MTINSTFRFFLIARVLQWKHLLWVLCFYIGSNYPSLQAQSFTENFDDITLLPGNGWALVNASSPLGITGWFQGNNTVFSAFNGATDSYISANFNNTTGANTISNWLMSPMRTFNNGDVISFYTRTVDVPAFPDRLRLMLSTNGVSTAPADFTVTLLSVNNGLTTSGYPNSWTQFSATLSGLPPGGASGRFALKYDVTNGGPTGANSDYIGIDNVVYTAAT
ncbi:MAG TPA: choice-of-anchor J domain-containing protein, partial [Saprospiraceae bacterium]|nr:choice-of-anchor J domain-containing protein [Saprospiraceae bacterium]